MIKVKRACVIIVVCAVHLVTPAFAMIDVVPKEAVIRNKPVSVRIDNNGQRPEFLSVTLSQLLNPGVEQADEQLVPISLIQQPKLFAFPFRLTLAPGQRKTITIKPLAEVDSEHVYRLDIRPVVSLQDAAYNGTAGSVMVNLAFNTLVRQLPTDLNLRFDVECVAEGALLRASGNARVSVEGVIRSGVALDPFNIYPGQPIYLKGDSIQVPGHATCSG